MKKLSLLPVLIVATACGDGLTSPDVQPALSASSAPHMVPLKGYGTWAAVGFTLDCDATRPPGETGAALVQGEMRVTHLGRSAWEFTNCWDLTTTPNTLILGTGSLTGANGDQVFYTQTVASFVGADFVMDWVIDGGTGRFEGATGNASLSGTTTDLATLCCGDGRLDGKISSVGSTH